MADIISAVRREVPDEVFDYQVLMDALSSYRKPRDTVTRLLSEGSIIRIKKGLYCFGEAHRRRALSLEHIANLIYGPSYVSLEYAMSYYGMIPERVHTVTSVTSKRSRRFDTPLGEFSYRMLSGARYATGETIESTAKSPFLIATPEKALIDKVWTDSRFDGRRMTEFEEYLTEDLRIDTETLGKLEHRRLAEINEAYGSAKIRKLVACLTAIRGDGNE